MPAAPIRSEGPRRVGNVVLTVAALAWLGRFGLEPWLLLERTPGDFENYYRAAQALAAGRSPYLIHDFDYPPLLAFLLLPLAHLPFDLARRSWLLVGQLSLLGAAVACRRLAGGDRRATLAVATLWAFSGTMLENLVLGQVNPLLLLLLTAAASVVSRRPTLAATLVALATALKLWPGLVLLAFTLAGRRRQLAIGSATAAALVAVPLVLLHLLTPGPVLPTSSRYWAGAPAPLNLSLPALAMKLAERPEAGEPLPGSWLRGNDPGSYEPPLELAVLSIATSLAVLAAGLLLLLRAAARDRRREQAAILIVALVSLAIVAAPISWYHNHLLQLPALALLAVDASKRRSWARLALVAVATCGLTYSALGFEHYVAVWGWTAARPGLLWLLTALAPASTLLVLVWLRQLLRGPARARV